MGVFWRRVRVEGDSMLPTYAAGDRLLVARHARVRCGDVIAVADPRQPARVLVKRVAAVGADGAVEVRGDNPAASTDSRHFGEVPRSMVQGRVIRRY